MYVCLPVSLSTCLPSCLFVYLSVCIYVCKYAYLSFYLPVFYKSGLNIYKCSNIRFSCFQITEFITPTIRMRIVLFLNGKYNFSLLSGIKTLKNMKILEMCLIGLCILLLIFLLIQGYTSVSRCTIFIQTYISHT